MVTESDASKAANQRISWGGRLSLAAVVYSATVTSVAFASDQTIGSLASPGDLQLTISDNGLVRPQTNDGGVINDLWFSGDASAILFRFNDGSLRVFKAGGGYFDSGTPTAVTNISNSTVGNTVTTQYRLGAAAGDPLVSQVVTLNTGTRSFDISWTISAQASGPNLTGFRLVYGGDATLLGDDNGTGEWDEATSAVGVIPIGIAGTGKVQLVGVTAPSAYQANNQSQVRLSGSNANLNNGISSTATDIAMALQWNLGTIAANTSSAVQARVVYTVSEQTATPTPAGSPTWTPTPTVTPTAGGTLTPSITPQPTPTPTSTPEEQPLPDDTISGVVRDEAGTPIRGALVYVLQVGAARTDGNGSFVLTGATPGESYLLRVQRVGFDFSGAPITVDYGEYLSLVGISTDYNPAGCREEDVSLVLSDAAASVQDIWEQARNDYEVLGRGSNEAFERLVKAFDAYLERSIDFPEVLIKCAKIRSRGYTRRPLEREKRLLKRGIKVLTREAFLANRRLRDNRNRSPRDARRIKKSIDLAAARATRIINRLSRYTFEVQ